MVDVRKVRMKFAQTGLYLFNCTGGAIFYVQKPNNRCTARIQGADLDFPSVNQPSYQVPQKTDSVHSLLSPFLKQTD